MKQVTGAWNDKNRNVQADQKDVEITKTYGERIAGTLVMVDRQFINPTSFTLAMLYGREAISAWVTLSVFFTIHPYFAIMLKGLEKLRHYYPQVGQSLLLTIPDFRRFASPHNRSVGMCVFISIYLSFDYVRCRMRLAL